uniref:CSON013040 protein n=1 Tax=Culicoides sonorensis TaxID=179676 RepID=A0A336MB62_CULSO
MFDQDSCPVSTLNRRFTTKLDSAIESEHSPYLVTKDAKFPHSSSCYEGSVSLLFQSPVIRVKLNFNLVRHNVEIIGKLKPHSLQ